jgi:hypothetical protein
MFVRQIGQRRVLKGERKRTLGIGEIPIDDNVLAVAGPRPTLAAPWRNS